VTDTFSYNGFGAPAAYSAWYNGTSLLARQYGYDRLGHIVALTETIGGSTDVYGYTYDLAGRLAGVTKNSAAQANFTYDSNSNRLTRTDTGGTVNGTYDAQDRLSLYGTTAYRYTANGELLTKTNGVDLTGYQYDELGNLLHVSLPNATQIDYLIDGQGRRIGKKIGRDADRLVQLTRPSDQAGWWAVADFARQP